MGGGVVGGGRSVESAWCWVVSCRQALVAK